MWKRMWREDEGVLTFEWILLVTVLVIGIVGGLTTVRDAVIAELADVAMAMISLDQSYSICPPLDVSVVICCTDGANSSAFQDSAIAVSPPVRKNGMPAQVITPLNCP
jgi:Flp pilus assembly pilin Flp